MTRSKLALALALSTALTSISVAAYADGFEAGSILIRARGVEVVPNNSDNNVNLNSTSNDTVGGQVRATNSFIPELDASYFFSPNVAVEAIAGMSRNGVNSISNKVSGSGTVEPLGTTWILPPTVTLQYHFNPTGWFVPYAGAGLNYTYFFDTKNSSYLGANSFRLQSTFGAAVQIGFDIRVDDHWYLNVDAKKIFLTTEAKFYAPGTGMVESPVAVDPWLLGLGVGYRF